MANQKLLQNKTILKTHLAKKSKNVIFKWAKDLNIHFSKKDVRIANKHITYSLGKCKSKTQKMTNISKDMEKLENVHGCWECKMVHLLWETV